MSGGSSSGARTWSTSPGWSTRLGTTCLPRKLFEGSRVGRENAVGAAPKKVCKSTDTTPLCCLVALVTGRGLPGECVHELLSGPLCRGICRHIEVHDTTSIVREDHQDMQDPESGRRDDEEVDGDQVANEAKESEWNIEN